MTFDEVMKVNETALASKWEQRKQLLKEAIESLRDTLKDIERGIDQPIPKCGLYEIYLGYSDDLKSESDSAVDAYLALQSVKHQSKFIHDLKEAVYQK